MSLGKKEYTFIVDEKDVTTVTKAINACCKDCKHKAGSCEWEEQPTNWHITFETTSKRFTNVVKILLENGKLTVELTPEGKVSTYYRKA